VIKYRRQAVVVIPPWRRFKRQQQGGERSVRRQPGRRRVDAKAVRHGGDLALPTDHVNGLLAADGTPAFPNAEVLVPPPMEILDGRREIEPRAGSRMQGLFKNNPQHLRLRPQEESHAV